MTHSLIPPSTTRSEIDDRFLSIVVGAPDFQLLNKLMSFEITLDMMMDSLRSDIDVFSKRYKNLDALILFNKSKTGLDEAQALYSQGEAVEARDKMFESLGFFREAGKMPKKKSGES